MSKKLDIISAPNPILRQMATEVETITPEIKQFLDDMLETMYDGGIGLAAPQVSVSKRILVVDVPRATWDYTGESRDGRLIVGRGTDEEGATPNPIKMINPKIVKESDHRSICMEGCLSIPQQFAEVERPAEITIEYLDENGVLQTREMAGLESHCVLHEIDHLDGLLFVDHLTRIKRGTLLRKLEKYKKAHGIVL